METVILLEEFQTCYRDDDLNTDIRTPEFQTLVYLYNLFFITQLTSMRI